MAKFLDKDIEEWNDIVEEWHNSTSEKTLQEYMELDDLEFQKYLYNITDKNVTPEEVEQIASKEIHEAVTELVIKPNLQKIINILTNN